MNRVIFFIKDNIVYVVEIYHKKNQINEEKKWLKQYCDF